MTVQKERMLDWAEIIDAYRVIPRILVGGYGLLIFYISVWFMGLPSPNAPQSAFVSTVWGAAIGITGFYVSTGRKWSA